MVIGHKKQQEFLEKIIKEGSRSLLFTGPESLGKKTVALSFFTSLFQEKPFNHPDFIAINPFEGKIRINQIRELSSRISLKPIKASSFGVIVDQAHLMNREAQNCFLKTLEEPKGSAILILVTEYPDFLLPTIFSRCERLRFYPVRKEEIEKYLNENNIVGEKADNIINISLGRPGKIINFLERPESLENRKIVISDLVRIMQAPLGERFQYVQELLKREDLRDVLIIWLSYLRESLLLNNNTESLSKLKKILNAIQETIFLISNTNTSLKLALEVLVTEF